MYPLFVDIRDKIGSKRDNSFHKVPNPLGRDADMHRTNVGRHKTYPNWHHLPSIWEILLFLDLHTAKAETIL
jgi:hypothetical protein